MKLFTVFFQKTKLLQTILVLFTCLVKHVIEGMQGKGKGNFYAKNRFNAFVFCPHDCALP